MDNLCSHLLVHFFIMITFYGVNTFKIVHQHYLWWQNGTRHVAWKACTNAFYKIMPWHLGEEQKGLTWVNCHLPSSVTSLFKKTKCHFHSFLITRYQFIASPWNYSNKQPHSHKRSRPFPTLSHKPASHRPWLLTLSWMQYFFSTAWCNVCLPQTVSISN